jgi:hypothetical protein
MKTFTVRASYSAMCETEVKANDIDEAYALAQKLDGSVYDTHCDPDDWHIEDISEKQPCNVTYTATVILTASRKVTMTFPEDTSIQKIREALSLEGPIIYWGEKEPDEHVYMVTQLEKAA